MARGFNVSEFRSEIAKKDILRTNRYLVEFFLPTGLVGLEDSEILTQTVRSMEFWVESATIPGTSMVTHDIRRYGYGPLEKRPVAPMFMDCTMTVLSDAQSDNWRFFKRWQQLVTNFEAREGIVGTQAPLRSNGNITNAAPYEVAYRTEYVSDVRIIAYDLEGNPAKIVVLREAFPINVGDIAVSWADNNSVMRFPVILSYLDFFTQDYYEEEQ